MVIYISLSLSTRYSTPLGRMDTPVHSRSKRCSFLCVPSLKVPLKGNGSLLKPQNNTVESLRRKKIRSIFRSHVSHVTTAMRKFTLSFTPDKLSYATVVLDRAHTQIRHRYTTMVRQADYAIGKATNRHKKRAHLLKFSIEEDWGQVGKHFHCKAPSFDEYNQT